MVKTRILSAEAQRHFIAQVETAWRRLGLYEVAAPRVTFEAFPGRPTTVEVAFDLDGKTFASGDLVDAAEFSSSARRRALAAASVLAGARLIHQRRGEPKPDHLAAFHILWRETADAGCMRRPV